MKKNLTVFLLFLFLLPSLILNFIFYQKIKKGEEGIAVLGVIDGDTLVLEGKTRLRLRSIDAPEIEFCGGQEAKRELENLVLNKKVVVKEKIIDTAGRPMGLVYVDGVLVNEEMLKTGWARFHSDISSQREILKKVYEDSRANQKGIFSSQCQQKTNATNPKCVIKGNLDKNSPSRIYYFPGCVQYETTIVEKDLGENWFCTEQQAQKAGFVRSERCPTGKFKN